MTKKLCLNWSNYVAQHAWTNFNTTLDQFFNTTCWAIFGVYFCVFVCRSHYVIVFSANKFKDPPPKKQSTICEHTCTNCSFRHALFCAFFMWGVLEFPLFWTVAFCWISKNTKPQRKNTQRRKENKMQRIREYSLVFQNTTRQHAHTNNKETSCDKIHKKQKKTNSNNQKQKCKRNFEATPSQKTLESKEKYTKKKRKQDAENKRIFPCVSEHNKTTHTHTNNKETSCDKIHKKQNKTNSNNQKQKCKRNFEATPSQKTLESQGKQRFQNKQKETNTKK